MKFHKTILTLLAVLLAVIGTTATVVHADGPETPPTIDELLSATDMQAFNGLRENVKSVLEHEFLPDLLEQGFTTADAQAFFTAVVRSEVEVEMTLGLGTRSNPNFFKCSKKPNVTFSVGSRVGVYVSASCEQEVDAFTAGVEIWSSKTGHTTDSNTRHNVDFVSVWAYADYYADIDYRYCGHFTASVNDTPTPQPSYAKKCGRYRT